MANAYERMPTLIQSERLLIRAPRPEDAPALNEAILETFDELYRWMPWARQRPTIEDSLEVCTRMAGNWADLKDFPLFAFEKQSGRFILASGCHARDPDVPSVEIGYWCRKSEQGKGYVTETVLAVTDVAFGQVGAKRIEIRCDSDNVKSAEVARRCGYILDAEFKNSRRNVLGELGSTPIFSQIRS